MSKASNNSKKNADAVSPDILEKVMPYLDGSFISDYGKGHARRLAAKQRGLEVPFRKELDESLAADLGLAYTGPGATCLVITTPKVAHRYLQEVHAQVSFEALKLAFHGMYAGGFNELLLKNEVERIQDFVTYSEEQDTHDAMYAPPCKGGANPDSKVNYRIADTSYAAEYLRLKNDFYTTHFYEGSPFDRPSMVYALCWLFLPYLKAELKKLTKGDVVPKVANNEETLKDIWRPKITGDEQEYERVLSLLKENHVEAEGPFVVEQNGELFWQKGAVRGAVLFLAGFVHMSIQNKRILNLYTAPKLAKILSNTFNIKFDKKPFESIAVSAPDEKYLAPFRRLFKQLERPQNPQNT